MEIRSDIECKGSTWYKVGHGYSESNKIFETFWGEFKICLAIGILYDKQIDDEELTDDEEKLTIPRTMFNRHSQQMDLFFQSAVLTSKCIDLSEKDRLYLAFSNEISEEEMNESEAEELRKGVSEQALSFDKIKFLKRFANYGATRLLECLDDNDSVTMENLAQFLVDSYNGDTTELIDMVRVEELEDDVE